MPNDRVASGVRQFIDDDEAYLRWLDENPTGYVVNSERKPTSNYLILHQAGCRHINSPGKSNWTTTSYIKTCSHDVAALEGWAQSTTGGTLKPCGSCKPLGETRPAIKPTVSRPTPVPVPSPVEHTAKQSPMPFMEKRTIPTEISTGCPELDLVWREYAADILNRPHVLIPDTDDELNWHAFLGHSIDMQGFRAAEFAGVDPLTKQTPDFVPLKQREVGVVELALLWEIDAIQDHLLHRTRGVPLQATLDVLRSKGGSVGTSLAKAFATFPFRKFHWAVRALLQNAAVLKNHDYSFRNWLINECSYLGEIDFPPTDFRKIIPRHGVSVEMMLRRRLEKTFYQVGPALAAYMLCDWQLWLWNEGKIGVFANFKLDSFHEEFVRKYGKEVIPADESGFANWWLSLFPSLPPRMANECIWLGMEHKIV